MNPIAFLVILFVLGAIGILALLVDAATRDEPPVMGCWIPEPHPWHPGCWQTPPMEETP